MQSFLEGNTGRYLRNLDVGKGFLNRTRKALRMRGSGGQQPPFLLCQKSLSEVLAMSG